MSDYPYRKGVNAVVVDSNNKFLIVQKKSYGNDQWDFPGGGLNEDETPETGILRELKEELGSDNFIIVSQSPINIKFEWPQEAIDAGFRKHGKYWRGQEKYQFIVKFIGNVADLKLQEDEIKKIKWVKYAELSDHLIFEGQWENAKLVIENAGLNSDQ